MNLRRPVGLICLAGVCFLICVLLVLCGVGFLFELFRSLRHVPGAPEYYSLGYVLMFLAGFCSFVAAWIAAVAGLDFLWFKMRGRLLTLAASLLLFFVSIYFHQAAVLVSFLISFFSVCLVFFSRSPI